MWHQHKGYSTMKEQQSRRSSELQPHCPTAKSNLLPLLSLLVPQAEEILHCSWVGEARLGDPGLSMARAASHGYNGIFHSHCWTLAGWSRLNKSSTEAMEQLSLTETIVNF